MEACRRLIAEGRFAEAASLLKRFVAQSPNEPEAQNMLGVCLLRLGQAREAEQAFRDSIRLLDGQAASYANLGMALRLQNRGDEAVGAFRRAVDLDPGHAGNFLQLFKQYQQLSRWDDAVATLQEGLQRHAGSVVLIEALALTHGRLRLGEEAERLFQAHYKQSHVLANSYAGWLQEEGRFAEAADVLEESLRLEPLQGAPYRMLAESKRFEVGGQPIEERARALLDDPRVDAGSRMHLNYALGKACDHERAYEAAMAAYDAANALAFRQYPACGTFDAAWIRREQELVAERYPASSLVSVGQPTDVQPIFIIGMIRSGTTLLDQIVSSHPQVAAVGESPFWIVEGEAIQRNWGSDGPSNEKLNELRERYLASVQMSDRKGPFTDKMPLNYRNLGSILQALPGAKVLHIRRDPFDTCLSIYTTFFAGGPNFAYNAGHIVAFYRVYETYLAHWRQCLDSSRMLEIEYESLVMDPEPIARRVLDLLGLAWDDACLRHDANRDQVNTPSRWQARQPMYSTSIGKREHYARFAPVLASLS